MGYTLVRTRHPAEKVVRRLGVLIGNFLPDQCRQQGFGAFTVSDSAGLHIEQGGGQTNLLSSIGWCCMEGGMGIVELEQRRLAPADLNLRWRCARQAEKQYAAC